MLLLWHNPRCSKSRAALTLLENAGADFEVCNYLRTPPNGDRVDAVLEKLGLPVLDLVRTNEPEWRITGLSSDSPAMAIRKALITYPILIQRPILEAEDRAVIGRPPERVLELL